MADGKECLKPLRDVSVRIQTSSAKERRDVFCNLHRFLNGEGLSESAITAVCQLLPLTLPRYNDSKSRFLVEQLIVALVSRAPQVAVGPLTNTFSSVAQSVRRLHVTPNLSRTCLTALRWSCAVLRATSSAASIQEPDFVRLVESVSVLYGVVVASSSASHVKKAQRQLAHTWRQAPSILNRFLKTLETLDPTHQTVVLAACVFKHLGDDRQVQTIDQFKNGFLELFVKTVIGCKTKPPFYILEFSAPLLKHVNHDDFRSALLPAMQKSLLRSPEIILGGVAEVVAALCIDLSQYAMELGRTLGTCLYSKEETIREDAALAIGNLARQCSDVEPLEKLFLHVVSILNGSEGKLAVAAQKMSVVTGMGFIGHNTVPASSAQSLAFVATTEFIKILDTEILEAILVHTLAMLTIWCKRFGTEVPCQLVDRFKKALALKTTTPSVRNAYMVCMESTFHGNTLSFGEELVPVLLSAVEKAATHPTSNVVVADGLTAAVLLLRLCGSNRALEQSFGSFWSICLDFDKQVFVSDKFLLSASNEALRCLVLLFERMFLDFPEKFEDDVSSYYRAVVFVLTRPAISVRRQAAVVVKKLLSAFGGGHLSVSLLRAFSELVHGNAAKVIGTEEGDATASAAVGSQGAGEVVSVAANVGVECLFVLCSGSGLDRTDCEAVLMEAITGSHHPDIASARPSIWISLATRLDTDPVAVIRNNLDVIWANVLDCVPLTRTYGNVVETLVKLCPDLALPLLVSHVKECLTSSALAGIAKDEFGVFVTPPDRVYDVSGIDSNIVKVVESKNVKRASKLYSHKEQLEELALKKEVEAKKKKGEKEEAPPLSRRQLDMMQAQLAKEAVTRERVRQLKLRAVHALDIVSAAAAGADSDSFQIHCRDLVEGLLCALQSPVSAVEAMAVYVSLHSCVMSGRLLNLGKQVCHTTLRLFEPNCELDPAWNQENLQTAVVRIVRLLHTTTVRPASESNKNKAFLRRPLSSPAFSYTFPLLNLFLRKRGRKLNSDEASTVKCLEILAEHARMRADPSSDVKSELYDPSFLPVKQMLDLLIFLLETTSGNIRSVSGRVLLQVAEAASGHPGCATASPEEIDLLLRGLLIPVVEARNVITVSLVALSDVLRKICSLSSREPPILRRVFVARFDPDENNRELAEKLWCSVALEEGSDLCRELLSDVKHPREFVRSAAAQGLASLLSRFPKQALQLQESLFDVYRDSLEIPLPVLDAFGRLIAEAPPDKWEPRSGVAIALGRIVSRLPESVLSNLTKFLYEGFSDRNAQVKEQMLQAALELVNVHGKDNISVLLPLFEDFLDKTPKSSDYDCVRQSVVVLMGALARHLEKDDPKVRPIVTKLIETLSTPSQQVQEAVANCLPPLVGSIQDDAPELVKMLLSKLTTSDSYGVRRGAAYGLAGLVKGLGILSLKQLGVMNTLNEAINNKNKSKSREGALLAFEMLCHMLGRLFEPYVVHILPTMLICFGDGDQYVRRAAEDTAKTVMSHLSVHGVKMVLPVLLKGLEENNWRTKVGSVELLGSMAFCAPKQLSSCLPSIVPKLIEILADSHAKVQQAGAQALRQIGSVIRNPEIQALVIVLLQALEDPSKKTAVCLQTLLNTKFVHFIDSPSLALIMPVVQRAFQHRSTETRKMAAEIIGNMYSVTDKKDLAPYLPNVVPGLKQSLLDPVPEVRCVAARALGTMVKGMGEGIYDELLPWLMQTLTSEASSVDRSGAAQGLSEVVGGQGVETLHKLMPNIIATANRSDVAPHVKDGYIMTFIYMPVVFQQEFTPYIGQIINPILKALADESEFVRETAFRAGQRIVNMYAESAITLLLPELEQGLFDENWRIRYSSVQLLGDLLYKISGVSGKMSTETANEDDNFGTEHSHKAILVTLGRERRNRVLAGLYMGRSDVALMVRQSALHVWKIVVTNTPRTLREILPTLFSLLLGCLASTSYDKRQVAARTLGDLVRKLGERVLPDIIPILERGLESDRSDQRQGVCIGLSEIMASTSKDMVLSFVDSLVPTVRKALCDPLPEVRRAAAKTFDSLHNTVGNRALDDILSPLLKQLGSSEVGEYALDGLRQVMAVKSRVVLPYLVPQLTTPPVNTKALSILASVAGEALNKHLGKILPALLLALSESCDTPEEQLELEYCQAVVLSVSDSSGVHTIIDELLEATKNRNIGVRRAATVLLYSYCSQTKADYGQYVPQLLRGLIYLFVEEDERILRLAWEALNAVTKDLEANDTQHVGNVRQAVRFAVGDLGPNRLLPGFCLPKGISSILPIFREAILNGTPELKEQAATGLGEVIRLTSAEALKPSVVNITGPLIRVLGDRFPSNVRVAVLETLAILLSKVGSVLKPFLPQLQTTFLKALSDPNRQVRLKAATALSKLIVIHTKADPLFTELHTNVRNVDDPSVRETMLQALRNIVSPAGDKMSDPVRKAILSSLQNMLGVAEDTTRLAVGGCLGAICKTLPDDELNSLVNNVLTGDNCSLDWMVRHGRCAALVVALKEAPARILTDQWTDLVTKALIAYLTADKIPIVLSGIRGVGFYLKHQILVNGSICLQAVQILSKLMNHNSNEVKQLVAQVGSYLAHSVADGLPDVVVKPLIPMLVNGTKEKNTSVKADSEFALVAILQLRSAGDGMQQRCAKLLDVGAREALNDVIAKVLRKVANQPEPKEEELDETLLT